MSNKNQIKKIVSHSTKETQEVAAQFAKELLTKKLKNQALVLAMQGELGAGKTTFLQGFAEGLGITEKVLSPTFIVMRRFELKDKDFKNFYHFDCYRLNDEKDLEVLDFKTILGDPKNIIAIEWSERVEKILPKDTMKIKLESKGEEKREIDIKE